MSTSKIVPIAEVKRFVENVMTKVGVSTSHAQTLADVLATGDNRGHYSHGINRLEIYVKDVKGGSCGKEGSPVVIKETVSTAWVDGKQLLGPVVGKFCMELAIKKAKETGIGWVVAKQSNHFGIAGYYSLMALEHKLLGMSYTNASPLMAPTRGKEPFFGTNPLSVSAPGKDGDDFVLDMATSVVALGKVEIASRREESIPDCWAIDGEGKPVTNPNEYHALLPLGGSEATSGYKGYGLATMIEIFTAVLGGATVAPHVRNWTKNDKIADLGQCFVAINPECFAPGFEDRMAGLMSDLRGQDVAEPGKNVLVAGDPERKHVTKNAQQGGIEYHPNQLKAANDLADKYGVPQLKTL